MEPSIRELLLDYMRTLELETDTTEQRKIQHLFDMNPHLDLQYTVMSQQIEQYNSSVTYKNHIKPPSFIIRPLYLISHLTFNREEAFDTLAHPITVSFPDQYQLPEDLPHPHDKTSEMQMTFGLLYSLNQGFAAAYSLDMPLLTSELGGLHKLNRNMQQLYQYYGETLSGQLLEEKSWFFTGIDVQKFNKLKQLQQAYESFQN